MTGVYPAYGMSPSMSTVTSTSSSISSSIPETERESHHPLQLPVMACYQLAFIQNNSHLTLSLSHSFLHTCFPLFEFAVGFCVLLSLFFCISFTVYTMFSVGFLITYLLKYFIDKFDRSHCYVSHEVPQDCWYVRISLFEHPVPTLQPPKMQ